jgi:hypothetical protein
MNELNNLNKKLKPGFRQQRCLLNKKIIYVIMVLFKYILAALILVETS